MKRTIFAATSIMAAACAPAVGKGARVQDVRTPTHRVAPGSVPSDLVGSLDQFDRLAYKINVVHRIPPDEWIELTTPEQIRDARDYYVDRAFLTPLADPFQADRPVQVWAHVGQTDALRLRYAVRPFQIELFRTAAMTLVWVDPAPPPGPEQTTQILDVVAMMLREKRKYFFFPGRPGETIRFSTNPEGYPTTLGDDEEEYDGGVVGGRLYLARYYIRERSDAGEEPFPHPWFGGDAILDAWNARRAHPAK